MSRITLNTNTFSLSAQRRLSQHEKNLRLSFDRLSSGLRITRASDDAAGLAISELLKTDTRLSNQALKNVNDGISMVSIISGALDAQKGILMRMSELAEQSANGTNSQSQRNSLQREYTSLIAEFDRIATSTKFNGISLLRNPNANEVKIMAGIEGIDTSLLSVAAANSHAFSGSVVFISDVNQDGTVGAADLTAFINAPQFGADGYSPSTALNTNLPFIPSFGELQTTDSAGNAVTIRIAISRITNDFPTSAPSSTANDAPSVLGIQAVAIDIHGNKDVFTNTSFQTSDFTTADISFSFSSGATVSHSIDLSGFEYDWYGWNPIDGSKRASNIGFSNVLTASGARNAIDAVQNRIDDLSKLQGSFGALESRLSTAANNLAVNRENYQAAASQITDVDVATEAANLTKTQILQNAAASILGQANLQPQIALNLLNS